jgi:hypothetical protein
MASGEWQRTPPAQCYKRFTRILLRGSSPEQFSPGLSSHEQRHAVIAMACLRLLPRQLPRLWGSAGRSSVSPDCSQNQVMKESVMGIIKKVTQCIPVQHKKFCLSGAHPDWEMHPSWIAGIEALDSYNHWVCEVVIPIAFQWIEEHKADVYATIAPENKDDVGVVMAAAFELIKGMSSYQNGLVAAAAYEEALANGTWETETINPVWTKIVKKTRKETQATYEEHKDVLLDTIR